MKNLPKMYKNMFTKEKLIAKSPKEQYIVELSTELEKTEDTNIKLGKSIQSQRYTKSK